MPLARGGARPPILHIKCPEGGLDRITDTCDAFLQRATEKRDPALAPPHQFRALQCGRAERVVLAITFPLILRRILIGSLSVCFCNHSQSLAPSQKRTRIAPEMD